jgi:aspartyl protease family protein
VKSRQQVPFMQLGNSMVVQGKVNGTAVNFIVDTGASLVVIPPDVARDAKISTDTAPRVMLQTANGQVAAPMVLIGKLQVAGLEQHNVSAVVQNVAPDGRTGLLGMNFLNVYRMSVDHDRRLLILEKK